MSDHDADIGPSTFKALTIRIKDPRRAVITAFDGDLSDEIKLRVAAWLVSDVARRLDVDEVELAYESHE